MSEWIEHDGKGCPVHPETKVDVRWESAPEHLSFCANTGEPPPEAKYVAAWPSVTHYRVVDPAPQAHMMSAPTEPAPDPLQCHVEMIAALTTERDALRAEVERLKAMNAGLRNVYNKAVDKAELLEQDNERLRKGRDDVRYGEIHSVVHVRMGGGISHPEINLAVADTLDPRLGTQLPDGEPVVTNPRAGLPRVLP